MSRVYADLTKRREERVPTYKVRPELTRADKHARLVGYGGEWVSRSNYRAPEVPPLRDGGSMGALCPCAQRAVNNLLTQGDALRTPRGRAHLPELWRKRETGRRPWLREPGPDPDRTLD